MSTVLDQAVQRAKTFEGFEAKPYPDPVYGYLTVGYGRNLQGKGISQEELIHLLNMVGLSEPQATYLLTNDISSAIQALSRFPWWSKLSTNRQLALIDMEINLGLWKLETFVLMIDALAAGNYAAAADQMQNSTWYKQVGNRAVKDIELMRNG